MKPRRAIRALLVDDEVGFSDILRKRLARRGIEITAAAGGTRAIQLLRGEDFDVAVVDVKLEDMDGLEVLRIFKMMVPELPVILLTGYASEETASEVIRRGANAYLLKPCDLDTLRDKILEAAGGAEEE
jgi:ActR/RegA family two-component response regulator